MDKLCKYIDKELEEMEEKVGMGGKLSRAEIEDGKNLAKFKMAILTNKAMEKDSERFGTRGYGRYSANGGYGEGYGDGYGYGDGGYSTGYGDSYGDNESYSARGRSRNAMRDSRGRYASDDEMMREKLRRMSEDAQSDYMRKEFQQYGERMR